MPEPGSPEWKARRAQILTDELSQPLRWFYLSFADDDGFRGAAIVEAHGPAHALQLTHRLGINPGGEIATWEIPEGAPLPDAAKNRLLSKEDLDRLYGAHNMVHPE
jgi:hypothetical protein